MPSREFWAGLFAGTAIATLGRDFSFLAGYYGAHFGVPGTVSGLSALAIAAGSAYCIWVIAKAPPQPKQD